MSGAGESRHLKVGWSAGDLDAPVFEWVGGARGYVWVGNEMDRSQSERPGRCAMTITKGQAKKLRDWLTEVLDG